MNFLYKGGEGHVENYLVLQVVNYCSVVIRSYVQHGREVRVYD